MLPLETERDYFLQSIPDGGVDNGPVDERSIVQRLAIRANLGLPLKRESFPINFTNIECNLRRGTSSESNLKVSSLEGGSLDLLGDMVGAFIDMKVKEPISFCLIDEMRFCLVGDADSELLEARYRKLDEEGMIDVDSAQNGQHWDYPPGGGRLLLRTVWFQEPSEGELEYDNNYELINDNKSGITIWANDAKIGDLDARILLEAYTLHIFDRQRIAANKARKTAKFEHPQIPINLNP